MESKESEQVAVKDLGKTPTTDLVATRDSDACHDLHFVKRGDLLAETSSSQASIEGYDPELMSGRTLLTAEEEKKLLRKIDWRLMTLCSLIFMFKNMDANNVCIPTSTGIELLGHRHLTDFYRHPMRES